MFDFTKELTDSSIQLPLELLYMSRLRTWLGAVNMWSYHTSGPPTGAKKVLHFLQDKFLLPLGLCCCTSQLKYLWSHHKTMGSVASAKSWVSAMIGLISCSRLPMVWNKYYRDVTEEFVTEFHLFHHRNKSETAMKNVSESVVCRFYVAMLLRDLWRQLPLSLVADKYNIPRGTVQSVMTSSAAFASCAHRFCDEIEALWPFRALFAELAPRLQHCAAPELHQLMELPAVKKARAMQLLRAGYKRIEDVARTSADKLVAAMEHLPRATAAHLVTAARMMLIEKVENLRAEAEIVMEELNVKTS